MKNLFVACIFFSCLMFASCSTPSNGGKTSIKKEKKGEPIRVPMEFIVEFSDEKGMKEVEMEMKDSSFKLIKELNPSRNVWLIEVNIYEDQKEHFVKRMKNLIFVKSIQTNKTINAR